MDLKLGSLKFVFSFLKGLLGRCLSSILLSFVFSFAKASEIEIKDSIVQPDSRSDSPKSKETPIKSAVPGVSIGAMFDLYYLYNFNRPASVTSDTTLPSGNTGLRFSDQFSNQISLNLAEISLKKTGNEVGFVIDLDFGKVADASASSTIASSVVVDDVSKHIGQAFITYSPETIKGLSLRVGKMASHVGEETQKAKEDWQYSRSLSFTYGLPFWHVGADIGYSIVPEKLHLSTYIYNGWNSIYDNNPGKSLGAQVKFTPNSNVIVAYNVICGPELTDRTDSIRTVHDLYGNLTLSQSLAFNIEFVTARETSAPLRDGVGDASWHSVLFSTRHMLTNKFSMSPRYEIYRDVTGYTLKDEGQSVQSLTFTNTLQLSDGLEGRLEFRHDWSSSSSIFITKSGVSSTQTTMSLALLYAF